jgi:surfeit locus 1 family protein
MNLRVNFNWKLALFVAFFLPILLRLGYWQLDRADEKRQMLAAYESLVHQPAVEYSSLQPGQIENYRNVSLKARVQNEIFLLDNQIFNSQFGYEVIQPVLLEDGKTVFISRGWVKGSLDRSILPTIEIPRGTVNLTGYLYQPNESLQLKEAEETAQWPRVVASISVEKLYKAIGKNDKMPPPFLVRLDSSNPAVFQQHWQVVNVNPEKHTGYAMQWFGMAVLLISLFIFASLKRSNT